MVNFGVVVFLKEREGDNLGDGKFSGIPNLKKKGRGREEEGKTHTHIKEMMARRRKFKTLGKIGNRETHNFGTLKKREAPGSAFSIYSRAQKTANIFKVSSSVEAKLSLPIVRKYTYL